MIKTLSLLMKRKKPLYWGVGLATGGFAASILIEPFVFKMLFSIPIGVGMLILMELASQIKEELSYLKLLKKCKGEVRRKKLFALHTSVFRQIEILSKYTCTSDIRSTVFKFFYNMEELKKISHSIEQKIKWHKFMEREGGSIHESSSAKEKALQLLGLSRNASSLEVKRAFRKKAKEFHPDLNGGDFDKPMKEINWAYETLTKN